MPPPPRSKQAIGNLDKESLNTLIPLMVRRPREVPVVQAHHERNQTLAVRPEPVEGLNQRFLKILYGIAFVLAGMTSPIIAVSETLVLEPVVVTADRIDGYAAETATSATRDDAALLETPYSVSVIDNAILKDSYTLRLEDAALFAAGVEQGSGQGGFDTDLIIRGFSTGGRVYLDGLLDNQKFQVRDMALVERIEILKGQSSVLYGSGSPGGTVNYISKKPQIESRHQVSLSGGNYDFARATIDSTGSLNISKSLRYRMIADGQLGNDFRANVQNNRATLAVMVK